MRRLALLALPPLAATCLLISLIDEPRAEEPEKTTGNADLTARIDAEIEKVWKRDGIRPAAQSDDAEFLRRVYLDTVGEPPTWMEATQFLDSTDKDKRTKLIDQLIDDPRFGRHMADHWTVMLTPRRADTLSAAHLLAQWFADKINEDAGFNTVIRELVTAEGELVDNPAVIPWFAQGEGVRFTDMIGKLSKNLMGVQIQCAECHDHPYDEKLTQKSFQGMAAFLTATQAQIDNRVVPGRAFVRTNADGPNKVLKAAEMYDKLTPQQKAQVDLYINYVKPVTLDGQAIDTRDPKVWRARLATWMLDSVQTRRYVANRVWSIAFGSGLLNPVDDFTPLNEASHPELLELLAEDLQANKWSIKRLYRAILKSRAWQLSSKDAPKKAERWHFAGYPVRPLTAEQFLATLLRLLDDEQVKPLVTSYRDGSIEAGKKQIKDREAQQKKQGGDYYTFDHATMNRFGEQFERMDGRWFIARWAAGRYSSLSQDDEMTGGENFTMSINQALAVMNGEFTNALAGSGKDSLLQRIGKSFETYEERIEALYLIVLARRPSNEESKQLRDYFENTENPTAAAEDLLYALLMTTEFATNH
ncbi:MAG: DUF1549 and DUF1553 domain-containing protein [Planctomycetota bacterium]|nr:DUF1549 and DUF1553 domain-containing protein [Planctomycetota bacterium]